MQKAKLLFAKKAKILLRRLKVFMERYTTQPLVAGNHIAVGRGIDITVQSLGRVNIDQIMMYEVKDGLIISEQFFY
jgi:hypothetical protein